MVPIPAEGRTFSTYRRVRLGDVSPRGRLRLDAIARYIQDVSNDDTVDAGLRDDMSWVVRKTVIEVRQEAYLREKLTLTTFCGGTGGRWAERRVSIRGEHGAQIEAATLWVHLDSTTGRPKKLPDQFHEIYDEAAQGRQVSARLNHPAPALETAQKVVAWPLRFTDFDVLGHVNNALALAVVEEERSTGSAFAAPYRAEAEYRLPIERGTQMQYRVDHTENSGLLLWLMYAELEQEVAVSAKVARLFDH